MLLLKSLTSSLDGLCWEDFAGVTKVVCVAEICSPLEVSFTFGRKSMVGDSRSVVALAHAVKVIFAFAIMICARISDVDNAAVIRSGVA